MRLYLTLTLVFCTYLLFSQKQMYSSITQYYTNGKWEDDSGQNYQYDDRGNIKSVDFLNWSGTEWKYTFGRRFIYNAQDQLIEFLNQDYNNNTWVDEEKFVFEYDNDDRLVQLSGQYWDGLQWIIAIRVQYEYFNNGRVKGILSQEWENGQWLNTERQSFDYSRGAEVLDERWNGIQWLIDRKRTYTYNIDGQFLTQIIEDWENGKWEEDRLITRAYDARGNVINEITTKNGALTRKEDFEYDFNEELSDYYYFFEEYWALDILPYPEALPFWNRVNTKITSLYRNDEFEPWKRELYNYRSELVVSSKDMIGVSEISLSPNPAVSKITLEGLSEIKSHYMIADITGRITQSGLINPDNAIHIQDLPSGIYVLNINQKQSLKFVKK